MSDELIESVERIVTWQHSLTKSSIADYVKRPLVNAYRIFYQKGIRTIISSANVKTTGSFACDAYITINYDSLSKHNKKIAKKLIDEQVAIKGLFREHIDEERIFKNFTVLCPLECTDRISDIEAYFVAAAEHFEAQC